MGPRREQEPRRVGARRACGPSWPADPDRARRAKPARREGVRRHHPSRAPYPRLHALYPRLRPMPPRRRLPGRGGAVCRPGSAREAREVGAPARPHAVLRRLTGGRWPRSVLRLPLDRAVLTEIGALSGAQPGCLDRARSPKAGRASLATETTLNLRRSTARCRPRSVLSGRSSVPVAPRARFTPTRRVVAMGTARAAISGAT